MFITFDRSGRLGNNLFEYSIAKIIQKLYGHTLLDDTVYLEPGNEKAKRLEKYFEITDEYWYKFIDKFIEDEKYIDENIKNNNVHISGYVSNYVIILKFRNFIRDLFFSKCDDKLNSKYKVSDLITNVQHDYNNEIVLHLRLDDFIGNIHDSHVVPPSYYIDILDKYPNYKVTIVCDKIRHRYEIEYLQHFNKYNPKIIQGTLVHDFNYLRCAKIAIMSNSSLAYWAGFLGNHDKLYMLYDYKLFPYGSYRNTGGNCTPVPVHDYWKPSWPCVFCNPCCRPEEQ